MRITSPARMRGSPTPCPEPVIRLLSRGSQLSQIWRALLARSAGEAIGLVDDRERGPVNAAPAAAAPGQDRDAEAFVVEVPDDADRGSPAGSRAT